jgi:hypothetical protein
MEKYLTSYFTMTLKTTFILYRCLLIHQYPSKGIWCLLEQEYIYPTKYKWAQGIRARGKHKYSRTQHEKL